MSHTDVMTTRSRCAVLAVVCVVGLVIGVAEPAHAAPSRRIPPELKWCLSNQWGPKRSIPDLQHQARVARRALRTHDSDFVVKRAEPSHLGVIALVDGNLAKARRKLRNVDHVASWTKHFLGDLPPGVRIEGYKQSLLVPVIDKARAETEGIDGAATTALWFENDAVVLGWKAPVPAAVAALAGVRANGIEVRVVPRPFSTDEILAAQDRLIDYLDARDVDWSSASPCASDAGIELYVPGNPARIGVTQAELDQAAGMRVLLFGHSPHPTF